MTTPTIAIALGAGGARGIAHIHALKALDELGIKPVAISGTSIGAILGSGYASGMKGSEIEDYVLDRFANRAKLLGDLLKMRPESIRQFMEDGGPRFGEINIERVIEIFLPQEVPTNFEELLIDLQIVATDYYAHADKVFASGALRPAIAASAAIPAVFRSVIIDGDVLIDGGMTNPTPFDLLKGKADIIIAVDVAGGPEGERGVRPGKIDVMYASPQLMQIAIANEKAKNNPLDILLRPRMGDVRALDFLKSESILKNTAYFKDEVKAAVENAISKKK